MGVPLLDRFDAAVGDGIERAMIHHHMRRLRRHGQLAALAPASEGLWAQTAAPPRDGNAMEVLIDGENALPRMAEAIRGAQRHVHVCSWHLEPDFDPGPRDATPVRELLAETAERVPVRVIVWAGAPVPVFQPRRGEVKAARERLVRGTKIQCQLDSCTRMMHCHHEKLVIVDDELAFVGGIDLTTLAGDRYDSNEHPHKEQEIGWHDARALLRGPIVRDVAAHFALRWEATAGQALPLPEDIAPAGETTVQFARTVPEGAYRVLPRGEFSVLETYVRALRSAQQLIYLENQFLWSPEIVRILETKLRNPPSDDFRVVVLLPHKANNGQDDTRGMLGRLVAADDGAQALPRRDDHVAHRASAPGRCTCTPRSASSTTRGWRSARANLNEHSPVQRHRGRRRHLRPRARPRDAAEPVGGAPRAAPRTATPPRVVDTRLAPDRVRAARAARAGAPLTHHLVELPGVTRRSRRLLGPLDALVVDG